MTNGAGKLRVREVGEPYDTPMREALYHNLAHQFFGLGQYVPTTALGEAPGTRAAALGPGGVPGAEHVETTPIESLLREGGFWEPRAPHQREAITKLGDSGELDKLALMNVISATRTGTRTTTSTPGRRA
jgi:hypothetical protein